MADQQREFDVEPIVVDLAAAPGHRTAHTIFDRVEVQVELLGGHLVARAATQVNAQCVTQPPRTAMPLRYRLGKGSGIFEHGPDE